MKPLLRPSGYQLIALTKLLLNQNNAVLIADGVGVGKTISAGYIVDHFSRLEKGPCLIVCPPGLLDKWRFELRLKFLLNPRTVRSHEEFETTKSELRGIACGETYICSYSELVELSQLPPFPVVVIDEIHNFRNSDTQRWRALLRITKKASWRIGLSATPINNAESDLGNELSILLPQYSPSVILAIVQDVWGDEDYDKLSPLITRFTKEQLGIHFAKRRIEDIGVRYPATYGKRVREIITRIRGEMSGAESYPLDSITYFREASSSPAAFETSTGCKTGIEVDPKLVAFTELLKNERSRMLVFCQFLRTVEYLRQAITRREAFVLTGDVPVADREGVIGGFRDSRSGVLLLTSVGSEGLDLQFCNVVVNYDLHWNPMVLEQRIGRCDRIGQKKRFINVYNFHVANSIDDRVLRTIGRKLSLVTGSPFDPKAIVGSDEHLFDVKSLKVETEHATSVLKAQNYSATLRTEDLSVIRHVDDRFCRPAVTHEAQDMEWLTKGPETRRWLLSIHANANAFTNHARRLQSYVA